MWHVRERREKWAGHVARTGEERKVYKVLVGKPEGKRPPGRPKRRWEDGIRMDLREIGLGGVDWIVWFKVRQKGISENVVECTGRMYDGVMFCVNWC
jgi:hypothetical protein